MTAAEDPAALLAVYDDQLRRAAEMTSMTTVDEHGPLLRGSTPERGFVSYRDLGGAEEAELDALIADTVAYYRDRTDVETFEWKTRGHDLPADLPDRLLQHGFEAEEVETVMMGSTQHLVGSQPPVGVVVRRAGEGGDLDDDVRRAGRLQQEVFGGGPRDHDLAEQLRSDPDAELWLAEADGEVICAGRLNRVPGTAVAGLWGGATDPAWRGRGIYRALTSARAASALAMGVEHLQVDCSPMSRPILERSGLVAITTTTPYVWSRGGQPSHT